MKKPNATSVVNKIIPELDKLKTPQLVKLANICVELIRDEEYSSKTRLIFK